MIVIEDLFLAPARRISRLLELPQSVLFETFYYVQLCYSKIVGFPYCRPELIEEKLRTKQRAGRISAHGLPQEELDKYRAFSKRAPGLTLTLILLHWIFIGKNLILVCGTISLTDMSRPASNLKRVAVAPPGPLLSNASTTSGGRPPHQQQQHQFTRFACMITNCSRLTPALSSNVGDPPGDNQFANDLIQLPLVAICMSHLRVYLNPLVYMHLVGLVTASCLALFIFVLCTLSPACIYLCRMDAPSVMDIMCPRTGLMDARARISAQLESLLCSQVNYCNIYCRATCVTRANTSGPSHMGERHRALERLWWFQTVAETRHDNSTCEETSVGEKTGPLVMAAHCDRYGTYLDDCLPLASTDWFRRNWCQAYLLTFALTHILISAAFALAILAFALDSGPVHVYESFARQTRADKCGFWRADDQHDRWVPIELDQLGYDRRWTWPELLEVSASLTLVPTLILSISIAHYFNAMSMFNLTIADLKLQMVTLIELGALSLHPRLPGLLLAARPAATLYGPASYAATPMRRIRNRLYDRIERVLAFWPARRRGTNSTSERLERQAFALELLWLETRACRPSVKMTHAAARELYLNQLERLHINYRLFMGDFRWHHRPVTVCLLFSFALNYGFALVGLYWFTRVKSFVFLPVILVLTSLTGANGLIVFSSRVHAGARKLEPHFMTLIGQLCQMDDNFRARHLRHLWLKQLHVIDSSGGLALRLFGKINVTYVAIIQSVIWSSSILLFTYTRASQ